MRSHEQRAHGNAHCSTACAARRPSGAAVKQYPTSGSYNPGLPTPHQASDTLFPAASHGPVAAARRAGGNSTCQREACGRELCGPDCNPEPAILRTRVKLRRR